MTEELIVARDGDVMEIRFNRPEKKNALTRAMYDGVVAAFESAENDAAIRVIMLTGTGNTFTSGNDIRDFQQRAATRNTSSASPFLTALSTLKKPLIAAVNGAAIGVGTTMLAHCDLIIAARSARFIMPFTRLGLVPEAGSSLLFPQLLGHQRASAMLLLGDALDAEAALAAGFVYQVVDDAGLTTAARAVAARLAALPPQAIRQTKQLMRRGKPDLPGRINEELELFRERVASPEAAEAFAAFMEKRAPDFSRFS
jgi:enoyl-CoA hydratase/carnithine racemase